MDLQFAFAIGTFMIPFLKKRFAIRTADFFFQNLDLFRRHIVLINGFSVPSAKNFITFFYGYNSAHNKEYAYKKEQTKGIYKNFDHRKAKQN